MRLQIMWQCGKCSFHNGNSSKTCHGKECDGKRDSDAIIIPISVINEQKSQLETVIDYCHICKKNQYFSKDSRKHFRWRWKCHGCKKLFHYKPDKVKKAKTVVPDDTWDGQ